MRGVFEFTAAVGLALAVHLVLLLPLADSEGGDAGGQGGAAVVTVAAASASVEAMVETWGRPPETAPAVQRPTGSPDTQPRPDLAGMAPDLPEVPQSVLKLPSRTEPSPEAPDMPLAGPGLSSAEVQTATAAPATPPVTTGPALPRAATQLAAQMPTPVMTLPMPQPPAIAPPEIVENPPQPKKVDDQGRPIVSPRPPAVPDRAEAPKVAEKPAKPTPKPADPAPASAPQQASTSAGSGGSVQAGTTQSASVKTLSKGERVRLERVWGGKIQRKIRRFQRIPRGISASATVTVTLTVATDGRLVSTGVRKSSGIAAYDQAALAAIRRAGRLPAAPRELPARHYVFAFPMEFSG